MSKSLRKDFRREIKKSFSRFLSILLIVVLGVAFYSGIRSSMPAMQLSADSVYDKQNLMDIRVVGTLGLTENDLEAVKGIDGVETVEGSYSTDFLCLANSSETVTKVIDMTDEINDIKVLEGRYPEKYNECLVSSEFLEKSGLRVGDYMTLTTGTKDSVRDTLASESYSIVGVCSSSYFLNGRMGTAPIGDGVIDGYAVIPREAFVTDVYTALNITVKGAKALDCFSDEYKNLVDSVVNEIEKIADRRCDIRYSEVRSQSSELLNDARNKYNESEAKVHAELEAKYTELKNNREVIEQSKLELEEKKKMYENAELYLPQLEREVADGESKIATGEKALEALQATNEQYKNELLKAQERLDELREDPNANPAEIESVESVIVGLRVLADNAENEFKTAEKELQNQRAKLEEGKATISQLQSLASGSTELLEEAEKNIQEADEKLTEGEKQYEIARQDSIDELADAAQELTDAENEINNMKVPVWHVLDRNSVESYMSFSNDAESIGAIGTVFPIIFFLVAALVSLTTMTRMVAEQRTQIGTLKALGYKKSAIARKFILYALLASVIGSVIGIFLGEFTIPEIIVRSYKMIYYNLEEPVVRINWLYGLSAAAAATFCTVFAAWAACKKELRSVPSELMRPESPKFGKKILIERIKFIWNRLDFTQKYAFRNIFRYKKRFLMTLFGVGGCMALLLVGLGVRDSVSAMTQNQYGDVFKYDGIVSVDENLTRAQRRAMLNEISSISGVESNLQIHRSMIYSSANSSANTENEKYAYLIIPRNIDDFPSYITLNERVGNVMLNLTDNGVIITEKYADILDVSVGDSIFVRQSESDANPKEIKVAGITENYIYNYVYMTPNLYYSIYNTAPDLNALMINTAESADISDITSRILQVDGVNSVSMNQEALSSLNDIIGRLYFVIIIMILAAGILAVVVLYNLNNINISERRRELATIKLLGYHNEELNAFVMRENIILTVLGIVLGIFMGIMLHRFVMTTVETDVYMFGRELSYQSILIGAGLTIVFSLIVNLIMYFKLKKIDVVESLKSVE